ncbi:MAG: 16S rRNA (guanine(966)-N(2))-methyltransferase RsmD [Deltaproteobacteria bacterium]|nr:16S rRNA (guanine(966)-N(2))-methyltransferase RsmD [Candidatus Tharpella sp.]
MRITGGIFKGKKINPFNNPAVRPSKSMLREALFSILGPGYCSGKVVGDFFSGSGIMALEAISRGAQVVYCADSNINSCDLIRKNFKQLNHPCSDTIFHLSADQALVHLATTGVVFDLIYLDPPYATPELGVEIIDKACLLGCLAPNAVAVLEHKSKTEIPQSLAMLIWKQKKYGHSKLTFYNRKL